MLSPTTIPNLGEGKAQAIGNIILTFIGIGKFQGTGQSFQFI
jgi:hypothetical protein